jgi:uncharacterized protein
MTPNIVLDRSVIAEICRRHHVARLSMFGSALRDDFRADSDVDLLVEFLPDAQIGLIGLARIELELSEAVGRKVDLRTPRDLSPLFRDEVLRTAALQYAA